MADDIKPQFVEDEDLERAKAWWKENGRSIVGGVVIGLSAVVGFNFWQSYQQTQAESASTLFEQLRTGTMDVERMDIIASDLMSNYGSTPYAIHAALAVAKSAVESKDMDQAVTHLQWVLDNSDDVGLNHIARLRLASVLLSRGDADRVLALLGVNDTSGFKARYAELSGDAYLQKADIDRARAAYRESLEELPSSASNRSLLQLKLDNTGQ